MKKLLALIFIAFVVAQSGAKDGSWDFLAAFGIILVIGYMAITMFSGAREELHPQLNDNPAPSFHWPQNGDFEFDVVGESHHQAALAALAEKCPGDLRKATYTATVIPESDNKYDKLAVRIDIAGLTVGHMSREDASKFRRRMRGMKIPVGVTSCGAMITGGYIMAGGDRASYGVQLDLKPFDS